MTTDDASGTRAGRGWQRHAHCSDQYADYFLPPTEDELPEDRAVRESLARALCRQCPVVQPCLDLATELDGPQGIWGGMNERERRKLSGRRSSGRRG